MRWFINSTKESAEISNVLPVQTQIDKINERLDVRQKNLVFELNRIHDGMHDKGIQITNILKHQGNQDDRIDELEKSRNNLRLILKESFDAAFKEIDKLTKRIEEDELAMEKAKELLRTAFNTITDLDNKVKALENQSVPKQSIPDAKSKTLVLSSTVDQDAKPIEQIVESCVASRKRLKSTFAEPKYMLPFKVALEFRKKGMKYSDIALELNKLNFKSPYGHEFYAQLVRDLLQNKIQRNNYIDSIFKIKPID